MSKYLLFKTVFCACAIIGFYAHAEAFYVTNRQIIDIDSSHTLYLLSYQVGYENYEARVPRLASRLAASTSASVVYAIENERGLTIKSGASASKIYSQASTSGDYYVIKEGQPEVFTLAVLHKKSASSTPSTLALRDFRFMLTSEGKTYQTKVSDSELKKFFVSRKSASTTIVSENP